MKKYIAYGSSNECDEFITQILPSSNISHSSSGMTTSTRITTLGILPSVVTWDVMVFPALAHRAIGHSNILLISLLAMNFVSSIMSTIRKVVPSTCSARDSPAHSDPLYHSG